MIMLVNYFSSIESRTIYRVFFLLISIFVIQDLFCKLIYQSSYTLGIRVF